MLFCGAAVSTMLYVPFAPPSIAVVVSGVIDMPGASCGAGEAPFDTTDSGAPYPAPPVPGVSVPLSSRHSKRMIEGHKDGRDFDSVSLERAAHRASRDSSGIPDFIFGAPAGDPCRRVVSPCRYQPVGHSLLNHDSKAPVEAVPRSKFAEVKYKKTALW